MIKKCKHSWVIIFLLRQGYSDGHKLSRFYGWDKEYEFELPATWFKFEVHQCSKCLKLKSDVKTIVTPI